MNIPETRKLLEQSQADIGGFPSKEIHERWQSLRANGAADLVEALAAIILPIDELQVVGLRASVSTAATSAQSGQENIKKVLKDKNGYDDQALRATAERLETNTHMQEFAFERVDASLPRIKELVRCLQEEVVNYTTHQHAGEEHALGAVVAQDTFNAQISAKLSEL